MTPDLLVHGWPGLILRTSRGFLSGRVPYVRTVRTPSGATAVQIVYSYHRGSRQMEHIGSAHDDAELELLKAVARLRLAAGQGVLELGPVGYRGGCTARLSANPGVRADLGNAQLAGSLPASS